MGGPKQSPYTRKVWPIQTFCVNFDFWQQRSFLKIMVVARGSKSSRDQAFGMDWWTHYRTVKSPRRIFTEFLFRRSQKNGRKALFFRAFNTLFKLVIFGWQPHIWARAAVESSSLRRGISLRISSALGATFVRFFSAGQRRRRRKKAFFDNERVNKEGKKLRTVKSPFGLLS